MIFSDAPYDLEGSEQVVKLVLEGNLLRPEGIFDLRTLEKNGFLGLRGVLAIKELRKRAIFFLQKAVKAFAVFEKLHYLCTRNRPNGALVQLVRIRACHARGQGFESPTHRQQTEGKIPRGKEQETRQFTTASFFVSPHRMAVRTGKGKADKGTSTSIREGVRLPEQGEGSRRKESPQGHLPYGSGKGKQ